LIGNTDLVRQSPLVLAVEEPIEVSTSPEEPREVLETIIIPPPAETMEKAADSQTVSLLLERLRSTILTPLVTSHEPPLEKSSSNGNALLDLCLKHAGLLPN
jgi:hypothetical protein